MLLQWGKAEQRSDADQGYIMSRLKNIAARRAAANQRNYLPVDDLSRKAFNCGRDLHPRDKRSNWLDQPEHKELIDVYHEGQAVQFECGNY